MIFLINLFSFLIYSQQNIYNIDKAEFVSKYAVYDSSKQIIIISSDVKINLLDNFDNVNTKIKAESAVIDLAFSTISFSTFTLETSSAFISGKYGFYNLDIAQGFLEKSITRYDRFIINSQKATIFSNKFVYNKTFLTTCDYEKPHYRISSSKIILSPGRYFVSYNNVLFIGKVPVIYLPVLYKPLAEGTPVISQFYPGYDERNGFYIKSNYTYRINRYIKIRGYLDYYSRKGFGTGGEFFGYKESDFKFNISYYRINEYGKAPLYWGINGGVWKNLYSYDRKSLYFQSFARLPSDPYFNSNYFRSNPFVVSNERQYDVSFTYAMKNSYLRANTYTIYHSSGDSFFRYKQVLPKIEYTFLTKKISFLPLLHSFYISAENVEMNDAYFQKHSYINYTLYNSFSIYRNLTSYTYLKFDYDTLFSTSSNTSNISIMKYGVNSLLRYSMSNMSFDLSYSGVFRSYPNRFSVDSKSSDNGVESSLINAGLFFVSDIYHYMNLKTGYDLKSYPYKVSFSQRILPFSFEYYKSFYNYELYFHEVYSIITGHKSFMTNMITNFEKNYLNVGFSNYDTIKERFIISTILGYNPVPKKGWLWEIGLRYYMDFSKDMRFKFFEKIFVINKEFHDFNAKFALRTRKDNTEFFFYITMKMNDPYRKDKIDNEIDKEFRPWRKFYDERDY